MQKSQQKKEEPSSLSQTKFLNDLTLEYAEMLTKFLEGIFKSLGYTVKSNTRIRGIIMMELESKKKEARSELLVDAKS